MPSFDKRINTLAMPARQLLPRTVGLLAVTYGVWLLASPLLAGAPQLGGRLYLIFPGIPGLLIGATGVLLWCQDYRRLAKLWIGILALVLLVFLTRAPGQLGVDLRNLTPDEPWPIVASFAIAGVAIWVCQRFVVVADRMVDQRLSGPEMSNHAMQQTRDEAHRYG